MSCDYCERRATYNFLHGESLCNNCARELPFNALEARKLMADLRKLVHEINDTKTIKAKKALHEKLAKLILGGSNGRS
tara:strand:- start:236 stop:469 length:234 start_codon:yes stop_codon:yes gene_type:complete